MRASKITGTSVTPSSPLKWRMFGAMYQAWPAQAQETPSFPIHVSTTAAIPHPGTLTIHE